MSNDGLLDIDELVDRLREENPQWLKNSEQVKQATSSSGTFMGDSFGAVADASELAIDIVSGIGEVIGDILSAIAEGVASA